MDHQCLAIVTLVLVIRHTVSVCLPGELITLHANEEKQIISVNPDAILSSTGSSDIVHCVWSVHSPSIHSSLVLQILDLDIEEDSDNYLEIRECDEESCPETCGEEFDPEEDDIECHQWCEETGPEEEFETSDSCAHVELRITAGQSERGLLLAFWSTADEITVVGPANFSFVNHLLFTLIGMSALVFLIAFLLILNHRKWHFTLRRPSTKPRLIVVAPATDTEDC